MRTERIFQANGFAERAKAIRSGGRAWVARNVRTVQRWADDFRLDIEEALAEDAGIVEISPPDMPRKVDVLIPFWEGDRHCLFRCVRSMVAQKHVTPVFHIVADACEFPEGFIEATKAVTTCEFNFYRTFKNQGPYLIGNAVVANFRTPYFAQMDADDEARPDRLWRQVARLEATRADVISSAMKNLI